MQAEHRIAQTDPHRESYRPFTANCRAYLEKQTVFALSTRRGSRLMMINRSTLNYQSRRNPQRALPVRLRKLTASRVRFGYRRLTVVLGREGWTVNAKRA